MSMCDDFRIIASLATYFIAHNVLCKSLMNIYKAINFDVLGTSEEIKSRAKGF